MNSPQVPERRYTRWRLARLLIRLIVVAYLCILLVALLAERWLVYRAPPASLGDWQANDLVHEDVWFSSADGTPLNGWFVPHPTSKRAILYCHGNAEQVAFDADLAVLLRDRLQASVFLFDYRGYGRSGGTPTEAGCIADGQAARNWLAGRLGIERRDIILWGRSLGGGVAVALASDGDAHALILENTFSTMVDVAAHRHWFLPVRYLMQNRYDSVARIQKYPGPIVQSHGTADRAIPIELARQLFAAAPSSNKRFIDFSNKGHEDWPAADYYSQVASFLEQIEGGP